MVTSKDYNIIGTRHGSDINTGITDASLESQHAKLILYESLLGLVALFLKLTVGPISAKPPSVAFRWKAFGPITSPWGFASKRQVLDAF